MWTLALDEVSGVEILTEGEVTGRTGATWEDAATGAACGAMKTRLQSAPFAARSRALEPLLKLNLRWNDYPKEPAPLDGSILHAIERLLPFVAKGAGYRYSTTHVPGITW